MIIRGDDKIMKGFLTGYCSARRIKSGLIFAREHDINRHHLRELLTFKPSYLHLIISSEHHRSFAAALRPVTDELKLKILSDRSIRRMWFKYEFVTYNRRAAGTIKRFFRNLPAEIKRSGRAHVETIDPSAKGVEVYSPLHDYVFRGEGELSGDIERLLRLHPKLKEHEFIDVGDINLKH